REAEAVPIGIDPLRNLWGALGTAGLITVGMVTALIGVKVGYGIFKTVRQIIDDWHDHFHPGGTSVSCPSCEVDISGATAKEAQANLEFHLKTYHPINIETMLVVVPDARGKFAELPTWVQDMVAVEAGIEGFYLEPDWRPSFESYPWYV
ncbi:unnamed protein product, partial [marine sediment metagenome]